MRSHGASTHPSRRYPSLALVLLLAGCRSPGTLEVIGRSHPVRADDGFDLVAFELTSPDPILSPPIAPLPVAFYLQGSEPESIRGALPYLAPITGAGIPVFALERRGIDADGRVDLETFHRFDVKSVRIADHARLLESALVNVEPGRPVLLLGASEGGDVAAAVAARSPRVTHLVLLGAGMGMCQADEFRSLLATNGEALGCRRPAELEQVFARIQAAPDSLESFAGHSLRRWSSYLWSSPLDDLLALDVPILLIHGTADRSVPVASARAAEAAFRAQGRTNLTLVQFEGMDHSMRDATSGRSRFPDLERTIVGWLHAQGVIGDEAAASLHEILRRAHPEAFEVAGAETPE